jgi:tetratricopeptide (TPR) repeat protein
MAPNNTEAYRWMAICQFHLGQWEDSFKSIQQAVAVSNRQVWPLANMGAMLARAKRRDDATAILKELEQRATSEAISPLAPATVYYGLGDLENFYVHLDRAIEERDFWLVMLHVDPGFDALRKDPRFNKRTDELRAPSTEPF